VTVWLWRWLLRCVVVVARCRSYRRRRCSIRAWDWAACRRLRRLQVRCVWGAVVAFAMCDWARSNCAGAATACGGVDAATSWVVSGRSPACTHAAVAAPYKQPYLLPPSDCAVPPGRRGAGGRPSAAAVRWRGCVCGAGSRDRGGGRRRVSLGRSAAAVRVGAGRGSVGKRPSGGPALPRHSHSSRSRRWWRWWWWASGRGTRRCWWRWGW